MKTAAQRATFKLFFCFVFNDCCYIVVNNDSFSVLSVADFNSMQFKCLSLFFYIYIYKYVNGQLPLDVLLKKEINYSCHVNLLHQLFKGAHYSQMHS